MILPEKSNTLSIRPTPFKAVHSSETIAEKLGTIGTTTVLRRTKIGDVDLTQAVKLDDLSTNNWQEHLIPLPQIFSKLKKVLLENDQKEIFQHGGNIALSSNDEDEVIVLDKVKECIGFGFINDGFLKSKIVFI